MDNNQPYDENFYRLNIENSYKRASIMLPLVTSYVHPLSVVDVGCGVGGWLEYWQKNFGAEIYGIDGDYVDRNWLCIDEKFFHPANLEEHITLDRRFDLAMSMEVAEHLSPARADSFVEDLTKLSDVIFFSAAIPAQGGTNHVNEQWQSYWAKKFLQRGYVCIDCIRPAVWNDKRLDTCRKQNPFIYANSSELHRYPELQEFYLKHRDAQILDAVHPELWIDRLINFQNVFNQMQSALAKSRNGGGVIFIICPSHVRRKNYSVENLGGNFF